MGENNLFDVRLWQHRNTALSGNLLKKFFLPCISNVVLQTSASRWTRVFPGESRFVQLKWCFLFNLKIFENVFSQGQMGFNSITPTLEIFMGIQKKKSCPRLKPPADLIFWATSGAVFGKKQHGKHPQYDVCSSFWRWLCGAVFEATAEATWSDIQNNPILIPQADQIYPVPGEATIAPAGPGVSSLVRAPCPADWAGSWRCGVAFAREVKDFYWKNMWYNIYIYIIWLYT